MAVAGRPPYRDKGMSNDLYSRINAIDLKHPYVWKLRISSAEFDDLEEAVRTETTTALQNVIYLAEWYKRCYDGGIAKPVKEFDCQKLFDEAGIDKEKNLFQTENGKNAWQYSIYVLGGVAIPFEMGKTSKKFLKELCKIYYGEDGDVDQLGIEDKARAVAFRESVRTRGSLYEYIKAVLSNDPPFAADDLADKSSSANQFIERIKSANDEVLKSKFDLEWLIGFDPGAEYMTRKLRLILKPESLGGLNHEYLKSERVTLWDINPDKCKRIVVGVRFLQDGETVAEPDFAKPILEYSATGSREAGFIAWHTERHSKKIDVPIESFNVVEIVARDDQGKEHSVEKFPAEEWMQVFRVPDAYNEWTSVHCAQRDSAVICPVDYLFHDDVGQPTTLYRKKFWVKGRGTGELYQWRQIIDKVCFSDPCLREYTLFNRQGYDQIVAVPHSETLRYKDGLVSYFKDVDGELEELMLPLVFGREDLIVRHFESRNDLLDDNCIDYAYEKLEFMEEGRYREWTDTTAPQQGKTTLRITIKGVARKFIVYFLPTTIERDCDNGKIICGGIAIPDKVSRDGNPIDTVVHVELKKHESDEEFVSLDVWRATKHKEMIRDGRVVKYVEDGEDVEISYALKDGLVIHDFSMSGYCEYDCGDINGIYALEEFSPVGNGHLAALTNQAKVQVSASLDGRAPEWLWINLAKDESVGESVNMLYWNFLSDVEPVEVSDDFMCKGNDVAFQDLKGFGGLCVRSPRFGNYNPFRFRPLAARVDLVKCFEVATEHHAYYFAMLPLRLPNVNLLNDLYNPLVAQRGGQLSEEDRKGLLRLAEEFGFDWREKYGISL